MDESEFQSRVISTFHNLKYYFTEDFEQGQAIERLPTGQQAAVNPTSRIRACKTRNLLQINAPTLKVCTTPTHLADACAAVIFGGGCAGNCNFNFSSNNCWSGSGCV